MCNYHLFTITTIQNSLVTLTNLIPDDSENKIANWLLKEEINIAINNVFMNQSKVIITIIIFLA